MLLARVCRLIRLIQYDFGLDVYYWFWISCLVYDCKYGDYTQVMSLQCVHFGQEVTPSWVKICKHFLSWSWLQLVSPTKHVQVVKSVEKMSIVCEKVCAWESARRERARVVYEFVSLHLKTHKQNRNRDMSQ